MPQRLRAPAPPPRGLRRESWRRASFAAVDFETTGLDLRRDTIVSFGVVPVRGGRVVLGDGVHRFVATGVPPSPNSMKIHHILPRDLEDAPPLPEASASLAEALAGRFLLTWYADVELALLRRLYGGGRRRWRRRTIDVRRLALAFEGADPRNRYGLSVTAARYGVPVSSPHEALDDALVTAQLFLVLATKLEGRGRGDLGSFLRLTRLERRS